jgi:hypothetical protein
MRLTRTLYIGGKLDAYDMVHAVTTVLSVSICRHDTLSDLVFMPPRKGISFQPRRRSTRMNMGPTHP